MSYRGSLTTCKTLISLKVPVLVLCQKPAAMAVCEKEEFKAGRKGNGMISGAFGEGASCKKKGKKRPPNKVRV